MSEKSAEERGIFERFAEAAKLEIVPGSIEQLDPPDIVCNIIGLGRVGFELTAVDDAKELTRMALNARTSTLWTRELASLNSITQARLHSRARGRVLGEGVHWA
jgi:hypothetical protein